MSISPELTVLLVGITLTSLIAFFAWITRSLLRVSGTLERVSEIMGEFAKEMRAVRTAKHEHANMLAVHSRQLEGHDRWLTDLEHKTDIHGTDIAAIKARCQAEHG